MYRKMSRSDRVGICFAAFALPALLFGWFVGWLALHVLLIAGAIVLLFCFMLFWAAAQSDEDDENDTPAAVVAVMKSDIKAEWAAVIDRARSSNG